MFMLEAVLELKVLWVGCLLGFGLSGVMRWVLLLVIFVANG